MSLFLSESGLDVVMLDGGAFTVSVLWPRSGNLRCGLMS